MSYRVIGGAGGNPLQILSYTVPASITVAPPAVPTVIVPASPASPIVIPAKVTLGAKRGIVPKTSLRPPPSPLPRMFVTNGSVTGSPDNPGMSSISVKTLTSPGQVTALRSAASNTAAAFNLPVKISADRATKLQQQQIAEAMLIPPIVIDEVVIPK